MITKSVSEARRHLSELIERARQGEEVVIIKDSRPAATLSPIDDSEMELVTKVSDRQAQRLWETAFSETGKTFRTAGTAVRHLERESSRRR